MTIADFSTIMRQWRRMCQVHSSEDEFACCDGCPLMELQFDDHGCDAIFSDWAKAAVWDKVEAVITAWAAEHPEPVYPTWDEWLKQMGFDRFDYIPAYMAERLDLVPKEE